MSLAPAEAKGPIFPGEITDAIIDHLYNDRVTLRNCARVCSAWLPASRHHLFEVFVARPEKCGLIDLLEFLTHIFVLDGYRGISLKNVATLIHAVPNVRVVELENLFISFPRSRDTDPAAAIQLSALRIASSNVTEHEFHDLFRLLGLFTIVRTLRMEENSNRHFLTNENLGPHEGNDPQALQVTELSFACMPSTLIGQLIRPTRTAHWETLRGLELDECIERWEQVNEIGKLLAEIGPRLRRLALKPSHRLIPRNNFDIPAAAIPARAAWARCGTRWRLCTLVVRDMEDTRSRWAPLNLAKCTNLDEFLLDLHYGSQSPLYDIHAFFKMNVGLLTTIAATVRCVKPRIVPVYPFRGHGLNATLAASGGPLQALDWPLLDETLSDGRFASPRVVLDVTELEKQYARSAFDALKVFLTGCLYRT
ncbi:hypothetical protein TRAPUB_12821, partial [Trametes pubescens]